MECKTAGKDNVQAGVVNEGCSCSCDEVVWSHDEGCFHVMRGVVSEGCV